MLFSDTMFASSRVGKSVHKKTIVDGTRAQVMGKARKICEMAGCEIIELEKDTPASNQAERGIQELKMETKRGMKMSGSPLVFWCYFIECRGEIMSHRARNNPIINGIVPQSMITEEITDSISHLCNFQWYEWVK